MRRRLEIGWGPGARLIVLAALTCAVAVWTPSWADTKGAEPKGAEPKGAETTGTEGEATPKKGISLEPVDLFFAGGWLMWPILACSVVAMWVAVERSVSLRTRRVIPPAFVQRFLEHLEEGKLDQETSLKLCFDNGSPISHVFAHGIQKWGKPSVEVEQAIIDGGERQVGSLRHNLRVLNGVYTVAPMLGLLGTVVGMIMSFNELAQGAAAGKSEKLAEGIAVALLTTAFGLIVAIPALLLYMYLVARVDTLVMEMDDLSQVLVRQISAEGLSQKGRIPRATPRVKTPVPAS